jgi:hypothetical protein
MRPFACGTCRSLIFFQNSSCLTCGSTLVFRRTEEAKRRLVHQLNNLGLPTTYRLEDLQHGLGFDGPPHQRQLVSMGKDNEYPFGLRPTVLENCASCTSS